MSQPISLKEAEQKAFRSIHNDGLWDVLLGCFFSIFALAPLFSARLGDFWSSFIFLPFWGLVYLGIRLLRKNFVTPRVGTAAFGRGRRSRLEKFNWVLVSVNAAALLLGILFVASFPGVTGMLFAFFSALIFSTGFSLAAYFLGFNRLYFYGLLAGAAPLVGEWLFQNGYATHHGYPLVFGIVSGLMVLIGALFFTRLLLEPPIQEG